MDLTHTFTVPASIEETWAAFNDLESVAGCFPGASLTSVEGSTFSGSCKVKLGPIAMVYAGTGEFVERDESAHRFVIDTKGKDKRGNGTANAKVSAVLTAAGPEATAVEVVTDLSITGKPAQFGRGMIQDVSDKLLQQFVECLESKVGSSGGEQSAPPDAPPVSSVEPPPGDGNGTGPASGPVRDAQRPRQDDALDLGATVLPILLKAYWKPLAGLVLALLVLKRLIGRR